MDADSSSLFIADAAYVQKLAQLSDEEFWRDAQTLARQEPPLVAAREYLECELSQHRCLLPMVALSEVCLPPRQYSRLPALPWWMRGLATWHSEVIGVVDLDAYLSAQAARSSSSEGMLLVALHNAIPIGLHVCAIGQTRAVGPEVAAGAAQDKDAAAWVAPARAALVSGTLGDAVILDLPALLAAVMGAIISTSLPERPLAPTQIEAAPHG